MTVLYVDVDGTLVGPGGDLFWNGSTGAANALMRARDEGLTVRLILNTHGHVDHIAGNAALKGAFPDAPLLIGAGDSLMLTDPWRNLSGLSGVAVTSPPADRLLAEGDVVEAAGLRLEVLEIPGHSPGHVVFVLRDDLSIGAAIQELLVRVLCSKQEEWKDRIEYIP